MESVQSNEASKAGIVEANAALKSYYESQESYLVYEVVLRGCHHFGYYEKDTYWPFPVGSSLERMEAKLLSKLALPKGSQLLDAGCGFGRVALYMAKQGMRVKAIDIIDHHVVKARRNAEKAKLPPGQVTAEKMDYQYLESIESSSYDGVYTMQAMGHATEPERAADGFFRIMKPGGRIAFIEAQRHRGPNDEDEGDELSRHLRMVNDYTVMPTNEESRTDYFKDLLENAGFEDVQVEDLSANVRPQLRLFYTLVVVPWFFVRLLSRIMGQGIEHRFVNMICATSGYIGQPRWRFIAVSATKPGPEVEAPKTK